MKIVRSSHDLRDLDEGCLAPAWLKTKEARCPVHA
jgi:hypothetical protein